MGQNASRRRLRSSTVVLGGMGVLAAALTSCGSEPDKRCVDPNSYDVSRGYRVLDSKACKSTSSSGSSGSSGTSGTPSARWYYGADRKSGGYADSGTFSKSQAVDRGGFGCSSGSGGG
ncbi:hypothetical protein J7W19_19880 [Streptomyces mobaraensis NBRC 13819 = DSM 40847]|uniref:Lipoprotein n=2 Tax=Streptomyces mobaraensis TaxID=35621 RepID=A0A5N5WFN5_STRMB|nr:hypothetical protein [Streptomyces mobaraensis]EMF00020.1 lipoprotein [Streptomyces mobaraensis NBRC 13819 = DSM 40847]KAB7852827.1 hypothetical protein FRZ00_01075 [Streptomyces mobaraensis]QTT75334.1 hypothetical protein J7W19_19880 [Streptomyces mobaraensis NBRC 13819 = DSM 40847]